jgi:6-phosphofructokinase 1
MLTGGGDCPGLNAVIRAAVRKGIQHYGDEFVGFMEGWRGVLDDVTMPLNLETTSGILQKGGTILRSSRTNVKKIPGGFDKCVEVLQKNKIDALIALGGDDTQSISLALSEKGVKCVGVMGRDAGWIAITSGIAGGADVILVPEVPIDIDEVCRLLKYRHDHGKKFGIVVVAEGAKFPEGPQATHGEKVDSFGHVRLSGIGQALAEEIEKRTKYETRSVNLGHTQRGGTPSAYDRMLATRYGVAAIDLVHAGKFGRLVVLKGTQITDIPIADAIAKTRTVGEDLLAVMKGLQPPK